MKMELNIGLDIAGQPNTDKDRAERAALALSQLAAFRVQSRRYTSEYTGPDGQVTEHGLFVVLHTNRLFSVVRHVYKLAVALGQDCIATYRPETGRGNLVGPQAESWGSFQLDFFKRFAFEPERMAA